MAREGAGPLDDLEDRPHRGARGNEPVPMNEPAILVTDEHPASGKIDLIEIISVIWARRWTVAAFIAAAIALASIYLHGATYLYTVELRVIPARPSALGGGKLSQLSGLASIAGVSLPQDESSLSFAMYLEGLKSPDVAKVLAADPAILRTAFSNEWNAQQERFVEPRGPTSGLVSTAKSFLGAPNYPWREPDAERLQDYLFRKIAVVQNAKSPVVIIVTEDKDRAFGQLLLRRAHAASDDILRAKAYQRAKEHVDFLNSELQSATIGEHRAALAAALTEQIMQQMAASSTLPYAAEPFGQPSVSLRPTSPRPVIVLASAAILGLVAGASFVLIQRYRRSRGLPQKSAIPTDEV